MRKKAKGKIYLIVGIYFLIINPIVPMIFNLVYTIVFDIPLDPLAYWSEWLMMLGWFVILLAGIGVYLIIIGYRIIKSTKENLV